MDGSKKAKVIKANYMLQSKVGSGPVDQQTLQRCQEVMDNNNVDFAPLAMEYLDKLSEAIKKAREQGSAMGKDQVVQSITAPVMQLKANASIFRYNLVGNLANVMLSFLESIKAVDEEAIQIVEAHHKTLTAIVIKKMKGDGGAYGKQLESELKNACQRYFTRRRKKA